MSNLNFLFMSKESFHEKFIEACRAGAHEAVAKMLTHKKADVNRPDKRFGATGLYYACQRGRLGVVKALLQDSELDVNSVAACTGASGFVTADYLFPSRFHPTPLHVACARGNLELVELLLQHPLIDANLVANNMTPLQAAINNGQVHVVRYLVSHAKVDINALNNTLNSALHLACANGHVEIAALLLQQPEIVFDSKNQAGVFPANLAAQERHFEVAKLFMRFLAYQDRSQPKMVTVLPHMSLNVDVVLVI